MDGECTSIPFTLPRTKILQSLPRVGAILMTPQIADELVQYSVGVVVAPARSFPADWDSRRIMPGLPISNHSLVSYLASKGVVSDLSTQLWLPNISTGTMTGMSLTCIVARWDRLTRRMGDSQHPLRSWVAVRQLPRRV